MKVRDDLGINLGLVVGVWAGFLVDTVVLMNYRS